MSRILISGGSGLLGSKLVQLARSRTRIIPTHFRSSPFHDSISLDIANKQEVFVAIRKTKPKIVIHTAAETNVDKCESERDLAWKTNVIGTSNIAEVCGRMHIKMIHVSTDYVFDGMKGLYSEDDAPNPINYYGLTKLRAEELIPKYCLNFVIARTSVLFGSHPRRLNFATWVRESLERGKRIQVVNNHFNSPTLADNLACALLEAAEKDVRGLYHMSGSERISRYEFSVKIADAFGLDSSLIEPIEMSELKAWIAKRPTDSSLSTEKALRILETKFMNLQESLSIMKSKEETYKMQASASKVKKCNY